MTGTCPVLAKEKLMRAAVLRRGSVEARIIDDPVPRAGQLLVRSLACGICASDLHFMDHPEAAAYDDSGMSTYDQDVDIVMGHEYCAEVVGYGPGTERRVPVGTRVSSLPVLTTAGGRKIIGQNPESPGGFGLNIQFGGGPSMAHWDEAFEAVCSGSLDVRPMLGRTVGLGGVPAALDAARDANEAARIVVVP
jgi:threonine dehydrogenase-like Zn-dependent dehydrogenase